MATMMITATMMTMVTKRKLEVVHKQFGGYMRKLEVVHKDVGGCLISYDLQLVSCTVACEEQNL